jgi:hypothetical protein
MPSRMLCNGRQGTSIKKLRPTKNRSVGLSNQVSCMRSGRFQHAGLGRVFLQIAPQRVCRRGIPRYSGAKSGHVGQEQGQPERPRLADTVYLQVPISGNQPRLDGLDFGPIQTMVDEIVVSAANPVRIDVPAAGPNGQADWQQ